MDPRFELLAQCPRRCFLDVERPQGLARLPSELIAEGIAFAKARSFQYPFEAIRSMAASLSGDRLTNAISYVKSSDWRGTPADKQAQALALIALARNWPNAYGERDQILMNLLERPVNWRLWQVSGPVLIELIPMLPAPARPRAVQMAIESALASYSARKNLPNTRALIHLLHGSELTDVVASLDTVADHRLRAEIIAAVLQRVSELPAPSRTIIPPLLMFDRWANETDRPSLFVILAASAWWLGHDHKHGVQCVEEVLEATFDVVRWWR